MKSEEGQLINRELVVVGAGVSGLSLATKMQNQGWSVAVIDKARGSGGRLSSKRLIIDEDSGEFVSFDLGCSDFAASSAEFKEQLQLWIAQGHVECIDREGKRRYTAVPRSSSLTRSMADRLTTRFQTRISKIARINDRWHCYEVSADGESSLISVSDYLVLAIPPAQAAALLSDSSPQKKRLESVHVSAQWVAMFILEEDIGLEYSPRELSISGISAIHSESNKPGRVAIEGMKVWLVHMDVDWTLQNIDRGADQISELVSERLSKLVGRTVNAKESYCHRWLYSQVEAPLEEEQGSLRLDEGLYAAGDWVVNSSRDANMRMEGVERAYLNATDLSKSLLLNLPTQDLKSA